MWIDKWEMNGTEVYLRDHSRGQPNGTIPLNKNAELEGTYIILTDMSKVLVSSDNTQTITSYIEDLISAL